MKYITGKRRQCECMWRGPSWHSKFTICPTPISLSLSNTYKTSLLHKHVFSHTLSQIQCFIHTFSHSYVPITHTPTKPPTPPFSSHADQKPLSVHPTLQNWTLKQLIVFKKKKKSFQVEQGPSQKPMFEEIPQRLGKNILSWSQTYYHTCTPYTGKNETGFQTLGRLS